MFYIYFFWGGKIEKYKSQEHKIIFANYKLVYFIYEKKPIYQYMIANRSKEILWNCYYVRDLIIHAEQFRQYVNM